MDIEQLSTLVALLAALSVAAERLVDIVKNWLPASLAEEQKDNEGKVDKKKEGLRKVKLQGLAIGASIITVYWLGQRLQAAYLAPPPGGGGLVCRAF